MTVGGELKWSIPEGLCATSLGRLLDGCAVHVSDNVAGLSRCPTLWSADFVIGAAEEPLSVDVNETVSVVDGIVHPICPGSYAIGDNVCCHCGGVTVEARCRCVGDLEVIWAVFDSGVNSLWLTLRLGGSAVSLDADGVPNSAVTDVMGNVCVSIWYADPEACVLVTDGSCAAH